MSYFCHHHEPIQPEPCPCCACRGDEFDPLCGCFACSGGEHPDQHGEYAPVDVWEILEDCRDTLMALLVNPEGGGVNREAWSVLAFLTDLTTIDETEAQ